MFLVGDLWQKVKKWVVWHEEGKHLPKTFLTNLKTAFICDVTESWFQEQVQNVSENCGLF